MRAISESLVGTVEGGIPLSPALTCYGGDGGSVVEMPCDSDYCTSIGCTGSDGMYVGYYGVYDPNTVQRRPDGFPDFVPYSDQPEAGGDYTCTMECNSMSCMQYQDINC